MALTNDHLDLGRFQHYMMQEGWNCGNRAHRDCQMRSNSWPKVIMVSYDNRAVAETSINVAQPT